MKTTLDQHNQIYQAGLRSEDRIIAHLKDLGHLVGEASYIENRNEDIDCYVGGVPVSIKTQNTAARTGNLAFELETLNKFSGKWGQSWYYKGKAAKYVIAVEDSIYLIDKDALTNHVKEKGWFKQTELKQSTRTLQAHHPHINARVGLLRLSELVQNQVCTLLSSLQ